MAISTIFDPWRLFNMIGSSKGGTAKVDFSSGNAMLQALIPSDQLWVAIKDVLVYEDYEFLERFRLSRLPTDATVLDAGAFVGLFSLKASQYVKRVVALEPGKRNFGYLESNIRLNNSQNVEALNIALSSATGTFPFSEAGTISSLDPNGRDMVKTSSLDDMTLSLGHVDLLKMDIEGAEYDVIGASESSLKAIDKVVAEIHIYNDEHRLGVTKILNALQNNGFRVEILSSPFQGMLYGMMKPWNCALKRYNDSNASMYRLLLSGIYGIAPAVKVLKRTREIGSESLLFAHRD